MFQLNRSSRLVAGTTALAVSAVFGLGGCAGAGDEKSATDSPSSSGVGGTLTFAANFGPVSLDPALQGVDQVNNLYINAAYDTLTRLDGKGNVVPDLATSWKYTDAKNTTFQLTLRKGVKFSDGTAMTAHDVAKSLTYSKTKGVNGPNWLGSVSSITAPNDSTVRIKTSEPNDSLPYVLAQRTLLGSIISPAGLADVAKLKTGTYGAGPYVLDASNTVAGDHYTYTPNKNYWDKSKIHWKKVVIKVAGNTTSALQAIQNGEADFMSGDATTGRAAKSAGLGISTAAFGLTGVGIFDTKGTVVPALKNVKVRQALLYALDRKSLATAVFNGFATPGNSIVSRGFPGYSSKIDSAYSFNLGKAKQLMKDAGYANGFTVNIAAPTSNNTNILAQAIAQEWSKIGVTAKLTTYTDLGQLTTDILAGKYPITVFNYGALPTYIEAKSFFTGGKTQFNPFNTTDEQIASGLRSAAATRGSAQQDAYAKVISEAQLDNAYVGNVYTRQQIAIYDKTKVSGFNLSSPDPIPDFWNMVPAS